jgi:hypothetical protein
MPLGFILGIPSQTIIEQLITNLIHSSQHAATSFTTTCSNSTRVYPNHSERNSEVDFGTSSLLSPPETKTSFSEETDRSVKKDKTRFYKDEQKAVNFDLSLFWRLEKFANLDGAYAVESEKRFNSFTD